MPRSSRSRSMRSPSASPSASRGPSRSPSPAPSPRRRKAPKSPAKAGKQADKTTLLVDQEDKKKWASWWQRTRYTLLMVISFLLIVFVGRQPACLILVFALQAFMYKELVQLMFKYQAENEVPEFRRLYYWWFFVCVFFTYGRTLYRHFAAHRFDELFGSTLVAVLRWHTAISFGLYVVGIITFVLSLRKKKHYKYQFAQFAYAHVVLFVVVVQSTALVYNMYQGLIWFLMPTALVICNDVFAYICGFFWGRTPLIPRLSPKKTVEGFAGAAVVTLVFAFFFSRFLAIFDAMVCPHTGFSLHFQPCERDAMFVPVPLAETFPNAVGVLPAALMALTTSPVQYHALVLAAFASLAAPFGGFFASGFKRSVGVKDFGDAIPGHGGLTDRFDCQLVMGLAAAVWLQSIYGASTDYIVDNALLLPPDAQLNLYRQLQASLAGQGLL